MKNRVLGRYVFCRPADSMTLLRGPSTYQMSLFTVSKPANAVVVHSLHERIHVVKVLVDGEDPQTSGDYESYLVQPEGVTGTAMAATFWRFEEETPDYFCAISEEVTGDYLGVSTYVGISNTSTGPQITGLDLGFTEEEWTTCRWATFAGYTDPVSGYFVVLALRVPIAQNSASFGSVEKMKMYRMVFDVAGAGTLTALKSIQAVTSDIPFEPHSMQRIEYIDGVGKKRKRLVAIGKSQPERYADNMHDHLLEVAHERPVQHGLLQLNAAGVWYTEDLTNHTGWKLLYRPQVADVEIPSEQAIGFEQGFMNFDIGLTYDRKWQRLIAAGLGGDATASAAKGREQFG